MADLSPEQLAELERRLWSTADQLRANSKLRASDYSTPVRGLISLRYADVRFTRPVPNRRDIATDGRWDGSP